VFTNWFLLQHETPSLL